MYKIKVSLTMSLHEVRRLAPVILIILGMTKKVAR